MADKMDSFLQDLVDLREKYPMVYIEAWTPVDFDVDWNSEQAEHMASRLYDRFDANYGTNWDDIHDAKQATSA